MSRSISKKEFIQKLALKMNTNEKTSAYWVDGVTDTLYETFREGQGVSLTGLGSFIWNVGGTRVYSNLIQVKK